MVSPILSAECNTGQNQGEKGEGKRGGKERGREGEEGGKNSGKEVENYN